MKKHQFTDEEIKEHLIQMGRNIGATFSKEIMDLHLELPNLIQELYYLVVRSKVKVTQENSIFLIKDSNSALDKYHYDDLTISGDYLIVSVVAEILERFGYTVKDFAVIKCRSYGDKVSEHQYKIISKREIE